ncbi:unnamed protein product [Arabis nemorensis]|uniref:Uncharacterized protein n=1 Tax=Arabis nemorensis TaxID=586526 RepID=A0A565AP86_9BRAS|nr:unnamed protein product [Arabis nemorensis]
MAPKAEKKPVEEKKVAGKAPAEKNLKAGGNNCRIRNPARKRRSERRKASKPTRSTSSRF